MIRPLLLALCLSGVSVATESKAVDDEVFTTVVKIMQEDPNIAEIRLCIENVCDTYLESDLPRKGGSADTMYERPKGNDAEGSAANAVSEIVGSVGKAVGVGGRVSIEYEQKNKDGSSVKVKVDASFGTGSGAAAGASGQQGNPTATK